TDENNQTQDDQPPGSRSSGFSISAPTQRVQSPIEQLNESYRHIQNEDGSSLVQPPHQYRHHCMRLHPLARGNCCQFYPKSCAPLIGARSETALFHLLGREFAV